MAEKTKVYYEFRTVDRDTTLVLDRPASITFQVLGTGTQDITINNTYIIRGRSDSLGGTRKYNWELVLTNNVNEIDVTIYTIRWPNTPPNDVVTLIIKYYENPNL
jgi:hypothetical protein